MRSRFGAVGVWIAVALLCGCGGSGEPSDPKNGGFSTGLTASEIVGVLAFVNACETTLPVLDDDARLDARAAANIVAHRNGADGVCGTADDDPFDDLPELDAISYVGDTALARLVAHANLLGYIDFVSEAYDGVSFSADEADDVLAVVNGATLEILDVDVGLDSRAASAIIAARPYDALRLAEKMQALAATGFVGQSALQKLKDFSPRWTQCATAGETVEGVAFSPLDRHDVMDFVNQATISMMTEISGIGSVLADRISRDRPYENLAQIGNVSGIGATTLTNVRDQVRTRWCARPGARCGCATDVSYRPPLVPFDEGGLYLFLAYGERWVAERRVDSGFIAHDGNEVVFMNVSVPDDPDNWGEIMVKVFNRLWDCCLKYSYFGEPIELGSRRQGVLHIGHVINAHDLKTYVMVYWQDVDDASFAWLYAKDGQGTWTQVGEVFLN